MEPETKPESVNPVELMVLAADLALLLALEMRCIVSVL
jgi:hypothetical protein